MNDFLILYAPLIVLVGAIGLGYIASLRGSDTHFDQEK